MFSVLGREEGLSTDLSFSDTVADTPSVVEEAKRRVVGTNVATTLSVTGDKVTRHLLGGATLDVFPRASAAIDIRQDTFIH